VPAFWSQVSDDAAAVLDAEQRLWAALGRVTT
jgi:hypothetical protein